jgi:hypothetical protein
LEASKVFAQAGEDEVKYDMQVLADRTEFYWTHLSGIGALENSLWAWDGKTIRIWLNALTIETATTTGKKPAVVKESVAIVPDFYPLCASRYCSAAASLHDRTAVLMDKGVIVGVDHETSLRRTLDFAIFRMITQTHLFLHHVLRFHLTKVQIADAVAFAACYADLVYFAHALEILLHSVLEDEADALLASRPVTPVRGERGSPKADQPSPDAVLPHVVAFLDHFDESLQVVVGCARKTEVARWNYLFATVGSPRGLFEVRPSWEAFVCSLSTIRHSGACPLACSKSPRRISSSCTTSNRSSRAAQCVQHPTHARGRYRQGTGYGATGQGGHDCPRLAGTWRRVRAREAYI